MPLQEALDVAEALVLLPEVDSVVPGRQMYTRATAQDLQVLPYSQAKSESVHCKSVRILGGMYVLCVAPCVLLACFVASLHLTDWQSVSDCTYRGYQGAGRQIY